MARPLFMQVVPCDGTIGDEEAYGHKSIEYDHPVGAFAGKETDLQERSPVPVLQDGEEMKH